MAIPRVFQRSCRSVAHDQVHGFFRFGGMSSQRRRDRCEPARPQQPETGVSQRRQDLRCCSGADAAGVFSQAHVPHPVQPVLDVPVPPRDRQQPSGRSVLRSQAGDGTNRLVGLLAPDASHTLQQTDLLGPGPVEILCQPGRCPNPSDLKSTMPFASTFGLVVFADPPLLLPRGKKPG